METKERKHRRWEFPMINRDEHNALYDAWAKAEAEAERLGQQNNELCDRVFELEARVKELEVPSSGVTEAEIVVALRSVPRTSPFSGYLNSCAAAVMHLLQSKQTGMGIHPDWLREKAEQEDNQMLSTGGLVSRIEQNSAAPAAPAATAEPSDAELVAQATQDADFTQKQAVDAVVSAVEQPSDEDWREKVRAAHAMVHALCQPRGSEGSREWIMSIPADESRDPDLVITHGLMAAEQRIEELEAASQPLQLEIERLRIENDRLEKESSATDVVGELMVERDKLRTEVAKLKNEVAINENLRKQHAHHVEVLSKYFQWGAPYGHLGSPAGELVDSLPKLVARYEACIAERDSLREKLAVAEKTTTPAPIAAAETLEQLAEIGWEAYKTGDRRLTAMWSDLSPISKQCHIAQAAAILRAAKPELDVADEIVIHGEPMRISTHFRRFLNSRIRYRFDLPTEERVRVAAEDLVKEVEDHCRIEWPKASEWAWTVLQGTYGLNTEQINMLTKAIVARCDRLRDAAENGKEVA
jgi:hypothetical protein